MSEFNELIKSFAKSREYVRDFFVYGFKTRDEFDGWSSRTYDNERRRLESWLAGYVRQEHTGKAKNIYLSIDSNLLDTNPLYRVWKAKSFTDNDIMLHFYILDLLLRAPDQTACGQTADEITDGLLAQYGTVFDSQIVRRKCNQYADEGILIKEKTGREVRYRPAPPARPLFTAHPGLRDAVKLYQLASPLGVVGSTIMDTASFQNKLFRIKHNFFVHTLEDEMLLPLLQAMHKEQSVLLTVKSTKQASPRKESTPGTQETEAASRTAAQSPRFHETAGVPLKIFTSTRTGRRYLCLYLPHRKRFTNIRMDAVKSVKIQEPFPDYKNIREQLEQNKGSAWGVSFQNENRRHSEHVKLTLHINEHAESYILKRLEREGKGGTITRTAADTFTYETDVFDANEMLPWLRTFMGRILSIESDCPQLAARFQRDFLSMYHIYFET